ncbi:MAG TPA: UxaA family hydrolase [Nitrospirota bacterium]|nr:UxaA family hydrolase [Nitrospirota bacterium]
MSIMELDKLAGGKKALVLDQKDNVAVSLTDLIAGDCCLVVEDSGKKYEVIVIEKIPFGHKFALGDMEKDEAVYKYGEEIGKMKTAIKKGGWIHIHNLYCDRGMK